jgi:putative membrane-bound dehydrogenase-like protein
VLTAEAATADDSVQWQTVYDLLGEDGSAVLRQSQIWTMRDEGDRYLIDLEWTGEAMVDVTIGKYDYGGLFLRMPWKQGITGRVFNSARQVNERAEGQRAVWTDVGIQVDGRDDMAHIAIFDHPQNNGFPQPWRVDSQMGVGPVRARLGDWKINKGQTETIRHQLVVFTGELDDVALTDQWSAYSGQGMAWAQWRLAQEEGRSAEFLTPEKAVESMTLQDGFEANVYASEPMMTQPMAFCWDSKGRMWIAENRDYETRQTGFSNDGNSRILILEDTDHDGVADSRKVFLEGIPFPAGIAVGMGGLWLGAPPNLLFIPDRDGDDKADMDDIEVRLTGWGIRDRHETLNSFIWGPDGWLYGCQGFATPSRVGKPAGKGKLYKHADPFPKEIEFDGEPVDINGGVWRYHATKDRFEVVAHGFSNPWGIDYDAQGQLLITACVIPHLWHVIPGGIYHRQGGSHFNRHVYSDIRTIADHRHRSAHGGARIYLSDALPEQYKNRIFMANIHEHAVLTDILEPKGSGFVGHHGDDFVLANNAQWIGFSIEIGPEGAIYVLDWHDADICGKEVLNKETGRIFRISPKNSTAVDFDSRYSDLTKLSDVALVNLQKVESAWHARRARVILQHRATARRIDSPAIESLTSLFKAGESAAVRLRAMWALHATGSLSAEQLQQSLRDSNEHLRAWAIQLLCEDHDPPPAAIEQFVEMAKSDSSPVVRLYLASAVQRLPSDDAKWSIVEALAQHDEDSVDHNLPKMIWFGLEPLVPENIDRGLALAESAKIPLLTRHVARRLADAEQFDSLLAKISKIQGDNQLNMLLGLRDAIDGRFDMKSPAGWANVYQKLRSAGGETAKIALQLSQQFGDSVAAKTMLATLQDSSANIDDRRQALQGLSGRQRPELKDQLVALLADDALRRDAIRAVAAYDDVTLGKELLKRYPVLSDENKQEVVHTLSSRPAYGNELTDALRRGDVPKRDVPAYVARLLRRVVGNRFVDVWGPIEELGADKEAMFVKYRELLTSDALRTADASNGRAIFDRTCAACHKLHGRGGNIGPDITGANRTNLEYLLGNILTPSAIIQDAYKMHIVLTDDGRIYSGVPAEENKRQLKLRIADREQPVTIPISQIESREIAPISMMPEGTLKTLKDSEVQDLIAYLQSLKQVPLASD